jgi:hypothetical protein
MHLGRSTQKFRRNVLLTFSVLKSSTYHLLIARFLIGLLFDREEGGDTVPPKRRRTSTELHFVTTQQIVPFE